MKKTFNFQRSTFNARRLLLLISLGMMALAMPVSADTSAETKMIESLREIATNTAGAGGGDASAANQTAVQANAGSDATKATAVQGVTGGKAVPVSGTFWQATQPVSGTFWQATQPVSGTFFQATQPVSLASVPSHAVTNAGTFPVQAAPKQMTGAPSNSTPATADATVFTLAAGEIGFIQNLDDAALAVKKGASASTSSFSFILSAGTAADDGKGGAVRIDDWVGVVSVAAMTGTARYIAWKQAP